MSTIDTSIIKSKTANTPVQFNDSGNVEVGTLCRAWVNFNGTGTVAIRASFNVTSITDNGTGDYTINFTNAMPDANYAVTSISARDTDNTGVAVTFRPYSTYATSYNASWFRGICSYGTSNGNVFDTSSISVMVFR